MQLFDGKTLNGWAATEKPGGWTVDHGCIFCTGRKRQIPVLHERPIQKFRTIA